MMKLFKRCTLLAALAMLLGGGTAVQAQFVSKWLDIGDYQQRYVESGALSEGQVSDTGSRWPAYLRYSDHLRAQAVWVGVKNWTSETGESFPYFVARVGPRPAGSEFSFPVTHDVISRFEDPVVEVDGLASFDKVTIVDEVDPSIPAERMIHTVHNMRVGVTVDVKAYAWANPLHDDYHIIEYTYTNTGNTDSDEEIELPNQTLEDVFFYRIHRWRGMRQEAEVTGGGQQWGKYSMTDVVGDGHADYPVDFTAIYLWPGYRPEQTRFQPGTNLGGPLWDDAPSWVAPGDSIGRLAGGSMIGRMTLHADNSTTDPTYDPMQQPYTLGFIDTDEPLNADGLSHEVYYEDGIKTREWRTNTHATERGIPPGRHWPHYADRIEPSGRFDLPTTDASLGKQGGHAPMVAYGPYDMGFGESIHITVVEGVGGLSYDARVQVGRPFKRASGNPDLIIEYDANGDGVIDQTPYDPNGYMVGSEALTKNQWVLTARDSLFKTFELARANWESGYNVIQPPRPPARFTVFGRPDRVEIEWETLAGEGDPVSWEIYRTSRFDDNVPYQLIATLPGSDRSYDDQSLVRGTDYYYHILAVGPDNPVDPLGLTGTPDGGPLRSSRYYTQTYTPVNLKRPPGAGISAARVVPNPVNLGSDQTIRFDREDEVAFFDIPGECTIKIFTEIGELVKVIEHTDGSGDEKWNMTTESRQLLVSGIYLAVIEDTNTGEMVTLPFTVLR